MTEPPTESGAPAPEAPAPEPHTASRAVADRSADPRRARHHLLVVSLLANFVKREALDRDNFRRPPSELIANDEIRNQVAATMVEQLYANVDVSASSRTAPEELQGPLGPDRRHLARAADRAARELLERPAVQQLFVTASSTAQAAAHRGAREQDRGGRHDERQRRPRHPAARAQARRPLPVRQQPRRADPAGRRPRSRS